MILDARNSTLYADWLDYIDQPEAKDAFRYFIGAAAALRSLACHPQQKGVVKDVRFFNTSGEQLYAFIPNKALLLFYFRGPAVRSERHSFQQLAALFPSVATTSRGEWTLRLQNISDVKRLLEFLAAD